MHKFIDLARYTFKCYQVSIIFFKLLGWNQSFKKKRPLDGHGRPIPWYTYPAIEFIDAYKFDNCRVFEYGSGNSSFFWSKRAKQVIAVENDPVWANEVRNKNIANLTVITSEEKDVYVNTPMAWDDVFDVVVIDGRHRMECAAIVTKCVHENGMIVFDNSDWYPDACGLIRSKGWFQIDFSGFGPLCSFTWTTSVFVKANIKFDRALDASPIGGFPEGQFIGPF